MTTALPPAVSRETWRTLEPVHAMVYFAPEPQEEYAAVGLDVAGSFPRGYFPPRAAAMGAVGWPLVQATFFNFAPRTVQAGMAGAWDAASPQQVVGARLRGADRALTRLCGDLLTGADEAAELARAACAGCTPYGRPLYAAHAALDWAGPAHLQLWQAITLLREFRGDGHIAALVTEGVSGVEAAAMHVAQGDLWSRPALQASRGYTDQEWDGAVAGLVAKGWLTPDAAFTDEGRAVRQRIEDRTDELALPAWEQLGEQGCSRLRELVAPLRAAVIDGGGYRLKR